MKRAFAVLCLAAFLLANAASAQPSAEQEVRALMEQVRQAALNSDADFFQRYFSPDLVRIEVRGQALSKDDAIRGMRSGEVKYELLEHRDLQVRVYGDTAVVHLLYEFKNKLRGQENSGINRVTRVLVRQDGHWHEVSFQATRVQ